MAFHGPNVPFGAAGVRDLNRSNLTVGFFVSLALVAFVSVTLWLSGRQGSEPTTRYSMYFYKDVSGLMLGGPVFYLGVEVGSVTSMEIITGNPMSVRVLIQVLASTPVDTGTSASLAFQGITGVAVINLTGDPGMNLPLKAPPGEKYPVIEVRDAGLAALLSDAPGLVQKLNNLLDQAASLVDGDNRALVNDTLENIASMSTAMRDQETEFAKLPASLNATLEDIRLSLAELKEATSDVRPGMKSAMENIEAMSERLGNLTARLDEWTADNSDDMENFMANGLGQVPELVSDARRTIRELDKLIQVLRENPSSLVYKQADSAVPLED